MKKKILIGALALASVFTLASATDGDSSNDRRFWGWASSTYTCVDNCHPADTGQQPDGVAQCTCTYHNTYYVMWVGFDTATEQTGPCK
ncbi:hypothetical protein [uncultured Chryseobacterium sp.]|uniref:hypothetical protein n=1 Tax=uncultured Chryseobacterium sp. TaxID=259322 RepID=UPI0027DB62CA|nr:hypothetical protein [uncultured Chryseobacterium sp.]